MDWQRCESRHARAREEEGLGNKRPVTGWEEGGTASLPDYAWQDFAKGQVDRVLDLMDINTLRHAAKGIGKPNLLFKIDLDKEQKIMGRPQNL